MVAPVVACPYCVAPTKPHCADGYDCGWRRCTNKKCGAFGDPAKKRWRLPPTDNETSS